jgi:hypothetical protein
MTGQGRGLGSSSYFGDDYFRTHNPGEDPVVLSEVVVTRCIDIFG